MVLPAATCVSVLAPSDPFAGFPGQIAAQPSPLVRTVRLRLDDGSTLDRPYLVTQLDIDAECVACGDPLSTRSKLCAACMEPAMVV